MKSIHRILTIRLPKRQSAFLWGARKVGKSFFLKQQFPDSLYFNLLDTDVFLSLVKRPSLLREQILVQNKQKLDKPIIIDEIQKVPQLLDEIHFLIENNGFRFILCGSSARKLKRGQANMLGGRAWKYEMFPLVTNELPQMNLLTALNRGTIPSHYVSAHVQRSLQRYVQDYLKEEVFAEGLTRNIPAFSRFFESLSFSHGELTNFANIARDVGVDAKTIREYYQILCDTLLGEFVNPYKKRQGREIIQKASKFYLFDVGVAGYLSKRIIPEEKGEQFGKALEHFIFMELRGFKSYNSTDFPIQFWRTKSGQEVDFVLGDAEVALEVKASRSVQTQDTKGLKAFIEEHKVKKAIIVSNETHPRKIHNNISILPWREFLQKLWRKEIVR